ncbi:hypothetical protein IWQ62_005475 [Dispira parvispora]|uniref:Uncharacterized protein n=1 Tax=Dispira parvispora TaxID=1520584 RepID=A0A9W8E101_9FUNG|nr:hypothetical protein IWQ62_005475 [Dispira parvispora]
MDLPDFSLGRCSFGSFGDESASPYPTRRDSEQTLDSDSGVSTTYSLPSEFGHAQPRTKRTRGSWDTLDGESVHTLHASARTQSLVVPGHHHLPCTEPGGPGVWAESDLDAHQHYFRNKSFLPWKELLPRKEAKESSRSEAPSFLVDEPSVSGLSTTLSSKSSTQPQPHHRPKKSTPVASPRNPGRRLVSLRPSYHTGLSFLPPLRTSHSSPRLAKRPMSPLTSTATTITDLPCPQHIQRTSSNTSSTSLRHASRLTPQNWQSTTSLRGLIRLMPDTVLLDTPLCVDPTTQAHFYRIDTTVVNLSRYSTQLQLIPSFDATIVSVTGAQLGPGGLQDLSFVLSVDADLLPLSTASSLVEYPILVSMRGVPQAQLILRFM